jgi:hypothetical protein
MNNYANDKYLTGTTSTFMPCKHLNGWWGTVTVVFFGFIKSKAKFFFCNDCCKAIPKQEKLEVKNV